MWLCFLSWIGTIQIDPAQDITTAGQELDYLDNDLYDLHRDLYVRLVQPCEFKPSLSHPLTAPAQLAHHRPPPLDSIASPLLSAVGMPALRVRSAKKASSSCGCLLSSVSSLLSAISNPIDECKSQTSPFGILGTVVGTYVRGAIEKLHAWGDVPFSSQDGSQSLANPHHLPTACSSFIII